LGFEKIGKKYGTGLSGEPECGSASRKLAENVEPGPVGIPNVVGLRENWQKTWNRAQWGPQMWFGFEKFDKKNGTGSSEDPNCGWASRKLAKKRGTGLRSSPVALGYADPKLPLEAAVLPDTGLHQVRRTLAKQCPLLV